MSDTKMGPPLQRRRWSDGGQPRLICSMVAPDSGPYCRECLCSHSGMRAGDLYCGPACRLAAKRKKNPEWYERLPRAWHQQFARWHGYYWAPCEICGSFHGGHENGGGHLFLNRGHSRSTCPRERCIEIARELSVLTFMRAGESPTEAGMYRRREGEQPSWLKKENRDTAIAPPVKYGWRWPWSVKEPRDAMAEWARVNPVKP